MEARQGQVKGALSRYLATLQKDSKKLEGVFASIEFQNQCSSFVIKDYLKVMKLFLIASRYGWRGWKLIEI